MFVTEVTSNVCYGCRDSSSLKGKDDCQVNTNKMEKLHTTLMNDYRETSGIIAFESLIWPFTRTLYFPIRKTRLPIRKWFEKNMILRESREELLIKRFRVFRETNII
jgi:hypothetical protein